MINLLLVSWYTHDSTIIIVLMFILGKCVKRVKNVLFEQVGFWRIILHIIIPFEFCIMLDDCNKLPIGILFKYNHGVITASKFVFAF